MPGEYEIAKRAIANGMREWFSGLREEHSLEHFYAVAIYTDGDNSVVIH